MAAITFPAGVSRRKRKVPVQRYRDGNAGGFCRLVSPITRPTEVICVSCQVAVYRHYDRRHTSDRFPCTLGHNASCRLIPYSDRHLPAAPPVRKYPNSVCGRTRISSRLRTASLSGRHYRATSRQHMRHQPGEILGHTAIRCHKASHSRWRVLRPRTLCASARSTVPASAARSIRAQANTPSFEFVAFMDIVLRLKCGEGLDHPARVACSVSRTDMPSFSASSIANRSTPSRRSSEANFGSR